VGRAKVRKAVEADRSALEDALLSPRPFLRNDVSHFLSQVGKFGRRLANGGTSFIGHETAPARWLAPKIAPRVAGCKQDPSAGESAGLDRSIKESVVRAARCAVMPAVAEPPEPRSDDRSDRRQPLSRRWARCNRKDATPEESIRKRFPAPR
jgi:hypothetical protein